MVTIRSIYFCGKIIYSWCNFPKIFKIFYLLLIVSFLTQNMDERHFLVVVMAQKSFHHLVTLLNLRRLKQNSNEVSLWAYGHLAYVQPYPPHPPPQGEMEGRFPRFRFTLRGKGTVTGRLLATKVFGTILRFAITRTKVTVN